MLVCATDYEIRASSTVALATELDVPMLVTNRTRRTYEFIDDDRIVVTRPAAMSEVQALKALRTGDASSFLALDPAGTGLSMGEHQALTTEHWGITREAQDELAAASHQHLAAAYDRDAERRVGADAANDAEALGRELDLGAPENYIHIRAVVSEY